MVALADKLAPDALRQLCERYHVRRLWLFGSAARGEQRPDSDLDVLVEFKQGHTPGLFRFGELADELENLLNGGRRVDLVTERSLHRLIRPYVLNERVLLYEG